MLTPKQLFGQLLFIKRKRKKLSNLRNSVITGENRIEIVLDPNKEYQTIDSFGASGAWWAQAIGGWTEEEAHGLSKRDFIAELLFDSKKGIGLSSYRYNLGAGSADDKHSPKIKDPWRRAHNFEIAPKIYDWDRDENAQYILKKAVSYGIDQIYLFANSPLARLTKNKAAYGQIQGDSFSNLHTSQFQPFIDYLFDVTEHFLEIGIPVRFLSPINEPQWDWSEGQEGAHYEPEEMVAFSKQIYREKKKRKKLAGVEISLPELGEWSNSSVRYLEAMIKDPEFMSYYSTWDIHSYWSSTKDKKAFLMILKENLLDVRVKMSEWTEMRHGRDLTMDSALILANVILQDLTLLNVTDWQYWIAVSAYDYRDGLIYVDNDSKKIQLTKRLWVFGNFSKYLRPGCRRIDAQVDDEDIEVVACINPQNELILVVINNSLTDKKLYLPNCYKIKEAVVTTDDKSLAPISWVDNEISFEGRAVLTMKATL